MIYSIVAGRHGVTGERPPPCGPAGP